MLVDNGTGRASRITYFLPCRPGAVYVNVTDRCLNDCRFCIKRDGPIFFGQDLSLADGSPDFAAILEALQAILGWPATIHEVVFCGMGEPLLRYECVLAVCKAIKAMPDAKFLIRLDTSGLHWSVVKRLEFLEFIDILSVSLNAEGPEKYEELCRPRIKKAFDVLMAFLKAVKRFEESATEQGLPFPEVRLSVVDTAEEAFVPVSGRDGYGEGTFPVPDIQACEGIASAFGWKLIVKRLFRDSRDTRWSRQAIDALCLQGPTPEACRDCPHRH